MAHFEAALQYQETSPSHPTECSANDSFFIPLKGEAHALFVLVNIYNSDLDCARPVKESSFFKI